MENQYSYFKVQKILNKFCRNGKGEKEKEFFKKLHKSTELAAKAIGVPEIEVIEWLNFDDEG